MTDQPTQAQAEAFQKEYIELCNKHKLQLAFQPQWKQSLDNGTYTLVVVPVLVEHIPQPEKK